MTPAGSSHDPHGRRAVAVNGPVWRRGSRTMFRCSDWGGHKGVLLHPGVQETNLGSSDLHSVFEGQVFGGGGWPNSAIFQLGSVGGEDDKKGHLEHQGGALSFV